MQRCYGQGSISQAVQIGASRRHGRQMKTTMTAGIRKPVVLTSPQILMLAECG